MQVLRTSQEDEAASLAAGIIAQALSARPGLVLGLATGRTMELVYAHLVRLHREDGLDFSRCQAFNLDEYVGLAPDHPGSYHRYMEEHLYRHVNIQAQHTHMPDGMAPDLALECQRYDTLIRASGGVDLQLLGLGLTGHLGFNEPPAAFDARTHVSRLMELTREQNAALFGGNVSAVPDLAITMGLGTILEARRCLLLVTGPGKAAILARAVGGPVTPMVPGSALQRHPDCRVIVDAEAAAELGTG